MKAKKYFFAVGTMVIFTDYQKNNSMRKITLTFLLALFIVAGAIAQEYTTPNSGATLSLDDIATASPSTITVSGSDYTLLENLIVAENDTLLIDSDLTLFIEEGLRITIFGAFTVDADEVTFTAVDPDAPYDGFRFEENSVVNIQNATITYGGGLRVLTTDFSISDSTLSYNVSGTTSSAVIQLSRGEPEILRNTFSYNDHPAIGSAANVSVSGTIEGNHIEANNQANRNRPQINLGQTIATSTLQIVNNTIIGDRSKEMVGGIAVAALMGGDLNANIEGNTIKDNRYGITIVGSGGEVNITSNIIEDNDTQGNPDLGGSGINVNSPSNETVIYVKSNEIRRNLWGITLQGGASINMGDDDFDGMNIFSENENGGVTYALFNNTPNTIMAKNNCWIEDAESTAGDVEDVIYHMVDDSALGEVIFDPFLCGEVIGIEDNAFKDFGFYPNPVKNEINFNNVHFFEKVEIYGVQGNLITLEEIAEGMQTLSIHLPRGLYFLKFSNENNSITKKMIVK